MKPHGPIQRRSSVLSAPRARGAMRLHPFGESMGIGEPLPGPRFEFYWSRSALRGVSWGMMLATLTFIPCVFSESTFLRLTSLIALAVMLYLAHGLACRAISQAPVVTIDVLGITDRRLGTRRIHWQEIAMFVPTDLGRSKAIEFFLVQPARARILGGRSLRLGGWLQRRLGLPAATISLLLLDAKAAEIASAVAEFRPGLLPLGLRPG